MKKLVTLGSIIALALSANANALSKEEKKARIKECNEINERIEYANKRKRATDSGDMKNYWRKKIHALDREWSDANCLSVRNYLD